MDVSSPISSVVPSLDGPILAVLCGVRAPLSTAEVTRLTEVASYSGVRKALDRLVRSGVVLEVPGGVVLNREHLASPAIELLASLYGTLFERLRQLASSWHNVALLGVFGSAARRDGDASSDIDVLLVVDDSDQQQYSEILAERILAWTGNRAHVIAVSTVGLNQLRAAKSPLFESWRHELVILAGDFQIFDLMVSP